MKITFLGLLLNLFLVLPVVGQSLKVEGTVTEDGTGLPLPGVNVVVEGTVIGTITDFDGNYMLEVPDGNANLVFSFIGMDTKVEAINNRARIDVVLGADSEEIEEVMVVAYGTTTKEAYTGAAQVVDKEIIQDRPVTSFEKSMQGTTAGLQVTSSSGQPGSSATVRIRGIGSFGSSAPLYVVDGVPISGALTDLNPNDIESLTVLKDAAASSLYGSRAANGVIIVTTKQGKAGQTKVSFSAQVGIADRVSKGYPLMNSTEFYEHAWHGLYNEALIGGQTMDSARIIAHDRVEDIVGFNPFADANPLDANGKVAAGTAVLTNTDWRDEVYKTGIIQNYNVNVSGGNENTKVFFSAGYFDDSGTTLNANFKRYSGKLNVTHKVNNWLTAGMSNHLSHSITNAPPGGGEGANPVRSAEVINAASPVRNLDGTYNWDNKAVFDFNPVGLAEYDIYEYKTNRALVNSFLDVQFTPSLKFRTTGAIDWSGNDGLNYYNPYHGNGAGVNGRSTQSNSSNTAWNISNILSYSKQSDNSTFEALIGQEAHGEEYAVLSAGVTDFALPFKPELVWGSNPTTPASYSSEWSMVSYLGQAKYNYGGKYYVSASIRGDGNSRFGDKNKYGLFYSVGGSWRLTEEEWLNRSWVLNNLKLRASYGTSGNSNIGNYSYLGLYGSGANYGGFPGITPVQLENQSLSWEKIAATNIGLETDLFERVSASFEFYQRNSDGLLYDLPLSAGKGITSLTTNLGAMKNTGFEATVNWDWFKNRPFQNTLGFNISTNKNKIVSLSDEIGDLKSGNRIIEVGGDIYQFYMREWAGVNPENGMPMWYTNEGSDDDPLSAGEPTTAFAHPDGSGKMVTSEYSDAERVRVGTSLPKFFGGINNTFTYKSFDFSFYFYYSVGGQIYNSDYAANMHDGVSPANNLSTDALNSWTPNNRYTDVPRYVVNNQDQGNQTSTRFLESASYLRLKNISFGYNLPKKFCDKIHIQNLRAFVSGENLWTVSSYKGFDPEASISGSTGNSIPGVKVVTFGLKFDL